MTVNKEKNVGFTQQDFSNATELADYLAKKELPFREAHEIVGRLVLNAARQAVILQDIPLSQVIRSIVAD